MLHRLKSFNFLPRLPQRWEASEFTELGGGGGDQVAGIFLLSRNIWLWSFWSKLQNTSQMMNEEVAFQPTNAIKLSAIRGTGCMAGNLSLCGSPGTICRSQAGSQLESSVHRQTSIPKLWAGHKHIIRQSRNVPMQHLKKKQTKTSKLPPSLLQNPQNEFWKFHQVLTARWS